MRLKIVNFLWFASSSKSAVQPSFAVRRHSSTRRALDVAVIGAPNVGKSLLTNQLVRASVSSVSSKMDTTTQNIDAVLTEDDVQLILLDSPGTVGLKHAREVMARGQDRIVTEPETALQKAEHILVVQDATATGDYIQHRVLHLLHRYSHLPSSLVINKIDLVTRRSDLLELTRILTNGRVGGKPIKIQEKTIGRLGTPSRDLTLHDETVKMQDEAWQEKFRAVINKPSHKVLITSVQSPQQLCVESVRAALLDTLPANVAYVLQPKINEWNEDGEVLQIVVEVPCEKERIGKLVLGKGGQRIAEIGKRVNDHMSNLFARQLFVRILVKHNNKVVSILS
ncbi:G domain-containing protein [Trichostrongylus colubriformis]|uniref:GTPase Era, mitochondrial n=1 Tax=Trichostrongylus colubriformis TaxID=6319 RepID=A0AAN8INL2_TRICO